MKRRKHSPTQCYNNLFLKWTQCFSREFRRNRSIYDFPTYSTRCCLLLRLFFFRTEVNAKAIASDTRGTREWLVMKRKGLWEGEKWEAKRCLAHIPLPAFLCVEIFIKGDDVWVWGRHKTLVRYFNERSTCDQQETFSLNGVTLENKQPTPLPPPLHSKFVSSLLYSFYR